MTFAHDLVPKVDIRAELELVLANHRAGMPPRMLTVTAMNLSDRKQAQ